MKIEFSDRSSVECAKTDNGNILLVISAKDYENPLKKITNAVEITVEEFKKLISDI